MAVGARREGVAMSAENREGNFARGCAIGCALGAALWFITVAAVYVGVRLAYTTQGGV